VAYAYTSGDQAVRATLWNGSTTTDLGTLGGSDSIATGINNAGQMVGYANTSGDQQQHATVWNGGIATDLNSFLDVATVSAGWILTQANAINDQGWIVGTAQNSVTGAQHAYLLTATAPVPEPESYALLLVGLGVLGFIKRRRKGRQS
jgi:probable HAF family extracellular repeat protein